jgi:hypothetical protein
VKARAIEDEQDQTAKSAEQRPGSDHFQRPREGESPAAPAGECDDSHEHAATDPENECAEG